MIPMVFCFPIAIAACALYDAARYRHLREVPDDQLGAPGVPCIAMPNGMQSGYYLTGENADFAVDAAMAEKVKA